MAAQIKAPLERYQHFRHGLRPRPHHSDNHPQHPDAHDTNPHPHPHEHPRLLLVDFVSLDDYLFLLRDISQYMGQSVGARAMWFLAAAVSDFYVPVDKLVGWFWGGEGWFRGVWK